MVRGCCVMRFFFSYDASIYKDEYEILGGEDLNCQLRNLLFSQPSRYIPQLPVSKFSHKVSLTVLLSAVEMIPGLGM